MMLTQQSQCPVRRKNETSFRQLKLVAAEDLAQHEQDNFNFTGGPGKIQVKMFFEWLA